MTEYTINISFTIDARDEEEATEIAKAVREYIENGAGRETRGGGFGHGYKLRDVETGKIEEL